MATGLEQTDMLDERSFGHVKSQKSTFVYRMYTGNDVWVVERVLILKRQIRERASTRIFGISLCGA